MNTNIKDILGHYDGLKKYYKEFEQVLNDPLPTKTLEKKV
jgi:hypothetical protein